MVLTYKNLLNCIYRILFFIFYFFASPYFFVTTATHKISVFRHNLLSSLYGLSLQFYNLRQNLGLGWNSLMMSLETSKENGILDKLLVSFFFFFFFLPFYFDFEKSFENVGKGF